MKLKVIQKGTHFVEIGKINNDVPTPAGVVAESLADVECRISEVIRVGGSDESTFEKSQALRNLYGSIENLNNALICATDQNWKLDLE